MHSFSDILILILASFLIGGLFSSTWTSDENIQSELMIQSQTGIEHHSLNKDARIEISGDKGECVIEVKDKKARIVRSTCQHQVCVRNGWLSELRPVVACIPNQLSIQLINRKKKRNQLNAFAF